MLGRLFMFIAVLHSVPNLTVRLGRFAAGGKDTTDVLNTIIAGWS